MTVAAKSEEPALLEENEQLLAAPCLPNIFPPSSAYDLVAPEPLFDMLLFL
jgi:hypothetical protein